MKVVVDLDKCILAGECYYNHPELFKMGENGQPVVLVDEINDAELQRHAREAAEVCPAVAISVTP
jgi:ferredoxin